jgi:hypothetical protein
MHRHRRHATVNSMQPLHSSVNKSTVAVDHLWLLRRVQVFYTEQCRRFLHEFQSDALKNVAILRILVDLLEQKSLSANTEHMPFTCASDTVVSGCSVPNNSRL